MTAEESWLSESMPGLSVVIIARNEAANIERAIESALRAVRSRPHAEVVLVDSASSDATVEIAGRFGITILRLKPSWYLSAAAGRYIGTCYTRGEFILYLDGDMELDPHWLDYAIPYAMEHQSAAALVGYRRDVYSDKVGRVREVDVRRDAQGRTLEVKYVSGAMLCRRAALEEVGGFQPFIKSEEEIDLSMRLRQAGYRLVLLPHLICRHFCIPMKSYAGGLRRYRLNLWLGYGQLPRYYLGTPLFWPYLSYRRECLVYVAGFTATLLVALLTLASRTPAFLAAWFLAAAVVIALFAIRKRSLRGAIVSCLTHLLIAYSALHAAF